MSLPPRSARRALVAATLTASFLAVPQAQAFERVVVGARHLFHCVGLLLSDPKAHAAQCLPNNMDNTLSSLSGNTGGDYAAVVPPVAPPVIVAPPPPPPPEEPVAEPVAEPPVVVTPPPPPPPAPDPCACGACYAQ